jgi:outer membrane protein TolC
LRSVQAYSSWRLLAVSVGLLLVCGLGGCAAPRGDGTPVAAAASGPAPALPAAPWWRRGSDPQLARLIDDGLDADARLRRDAAELARAEARAGSWQQRVAAWFDSIAGRRAEDLDAAARGLARARQRKAAAIALAYLDVRRLQSLLGLRLSFEAQFRDDADIARWRRKAGLVSAVDGGLAATLIGLNADALAAAEAELTSARAALARQTGLTEAELDRRLGATAPIPQPAAGAGGDAPARDRAAVAAVAAREAALRRVERDAERTATDAREAYRLGSGDFAAVYAAETALLQVREAALAARAERSAATIRLLRDAGLAASGATPVTVERCGG